jgi:cobalamin biosynthesis Mg chelatase CobN
MLLYAIKVYGPDAKLRAKLRIAQPEHMPSVAIYHPKASCLFESFADYRKWYESRSAGHKLDPEITIGLLLMRPQVISKTTSITTLLINALETEGLSVIPAIATLMDNREAVSKFFWNLRTKVRDRECRR